MSAELYDRFCERAGLSRDHTLAELIEAIRAIPHGRPRERSGEAVVRDWRGTCSTKHDLLRRLRPDLQLHFIHRMFLLTPEAARKHLGADVAEVVPEEGFLDVHTYATGMVGGRRTVIDVTFPGEPWDGQSDMQIPWGDGQDFEIGDESPFESKDKLVEEHGDPEVRRRLIEAISS